VLHFAGLCLKETWSIFAKDYDTDAIAHFKSVLSFGKIYRKTLLIRINWDSESFGYAENSDNWILL